MFVNLLIGTAMIVLNLGIQVWAAILVLYYFQRRLDQGRISTNASGGVRLLAIIMLFLFIGHILQFGTWAYLYLWLGEFQDIETAFYHSAVNFTSLGYGDIVMSEKWRLLGALEAANGVLMFGLSAGLVLSVMNGLLRRHSKGYKKLSQHPEDP